MKKIATLFFLISICCFFWVREKTIPVFEESNAEKEDFSYYEIRPKNINTFNFEENFSGYQVIYIEAQNNPLIEKEIKDVDAYTFSSASIQNNIYAFTKKYLSVLENHGFSKEISSISIKGIPIQKVVIFSSFLEYQEILGKLT